MVNSENAKFLKMAEGSTNEVRRTSRLCHVNYGFHTDWLRDLMEKPAGESTASLLKSFYASFEAIREIPGLGSFRALHICAWLFLVFGAEMDIPDDALRVFFGPNVEELERMCLKCGFDIEELFAKVPEEIPIDPVSFEIWCCKVVNFIFALNLVKQPSVVYRKGE